MRFDVGTTSKTGRISNTRDKVISIEFHARSDNATSVYFGRSDVSLTNGRELAPGESSALSFGTGDEASVELRFFYVAVTGSDRIDWTYIAS
jgi:hypothetical protein|tara:strand:+ start:93 stop:368 length:276 start_codon:yes stop_codon:yes gene_type:complete